MKRFVLGMGLLGLMMPSVASAALQLQIGPRNGTGAANADRTHPVPDPFGQNFLDLIFHETGGVNREGLFTYDIGLNLVRPGGATGGVNFVTGAAAVALGENNVFNTGNPPSIQISESTPSRLLFNITSAGDLNDIDEGEAACRIFYTAAPDATPGIYRITFDRDNTVFGSGDPDLPLSVEVELSDEGVIRVIPEPASLSLLGIAGLLALRRRRTA